MSRIISTKGIGIKKWLKLRENYLGASETSAALNLNPYRTGLDLWREKIKDPSYKRFPGNSLTKWGARLEGSIAWGFSKDYKLRIRKDNKLRIHDNGILSCSLDRLIIKGKKLGTLEIKNMGDKQFNRLCQDTNSVSMMYYSQIQQQFFVTELKFGYFVILVGGNTLIVKKTLPDIAFMNMQSEFAVEWWNDYVIQNKPPELDRTKYQALKKLLYKSDGWNNFKFVPDLPEYEETDPVKIFIREIEGAKNRTELNMLMKRKPGIIVDSKREVQSLVSTIIKIKHLQLRR